MPIYSFVCTKCKYSFDEYLKMKDSDAPTLRPCSECGQFECVNKVITSAAIVSGINMRAKIPDYFKDRMKDIKKMNPGSTIDV